MFYPQAYSQFGFNPQQGYGAAGYFNAPTGGIYAAPGIYGGQGPQLTPTPQQFAGQNGVNGSNGFSPAGWTQPQAQVGPLQHQHPQHQLLPQLAHYHYLVAQQLAQLAAQQLPIPQSAQNLGNPMAGQFIPGLQAAPFIPGFTMH